MFAVALCAAVLIGQTRLDYRQLNNAPKFERGLQVVQSSAGQSRVSVDLGNALRVVVLPKVDAANPFEPLPNCDYRYRGVLSRVPSTTTMIQTPGMQYLCVPDGTGSGFRLIPLGAIAPPK